MPNMGIMNSADGTHGMFSRMKSGMGSAARGIGNAFKYIRVICIFFIYILLRKVMHIPDCTLVTACFDLNKYHGGSKSKEQALRGIDILLKLPIYLVIFGNAEMMDIIEERRKSYSYENITLFVRQEYEDIWTAQFTERVRKNREAYWPTRDARTCPESHLVCANKFDFVLKAMEMNPFQTSKYGWIDSNLYVNERTNKICENYTTNKLPYLLNRVTDKFHIQIMNITDKKYKNEAMKPEYYEKYRWVVSGCLFTCGVEIGSRILTRLKEIVVDTTLAGYGHGEEMFYLEILDEFYDDIVRSYGDYGQILNNFIHVTRNINYIYQKIAVNAYNHGYFRESFDCAKSLVYSIENQLDEGDIDYGMYISILRLYYHSACRHNPEVTGEIVKKFHDISEKNKSFFNACGGYYV